MRDRSSVVIIKDEKVVLIQELEMMLCIMFSLVVE